MTDSFEQELERHRGSRCLLVEPAGSFGDQLILKGIEKKLKQFELKYSILRIGFGKNLLRSFFECAERWFPQWQRVILRVGPAGFERTIRRNRSRPYRPVRGGDGRFDAIVINGGGYLNDVWNGYPIFSALQPILLQNPRAALIISPQSILFRNGTHFEKAVGRLSHRTHFFCREVTSYNLANSLHLQPNVEVHLSPDPAFYLTPLDIGCATTVSYVLMAPRLDRESTVKWHVGEILNKWPRVSIRDIDLLPNFGSYVSAVASASEVYTDRLHVSILAALLGKKTHLLPNSYHKNESVYRFSMKAHSNVEFLDCSQFPPTNQK